MNVATANKLSPWIQISLTLIGFVFLGGANYQQAKETSKKTDQCEIKIETLAKEQREVVSRLEVAVARLEAQIQFLKDKGDK